jgi:hypothetical protein
MGPDREGFIPARRAGHYPGSYSVGYTRERNMPAVGTNGSLAITAVITTSTTGTIRRYRDLESPAARHERRRIGKAAGMAWRAKADRGSSVAFVARRAGP